jgi:hypothetical protein
MSIANNIKILIRTGLIIYFLSIIFFICVNKWPDNFTKYNLYKYFPNENRLKTFRLNDANLSKINFPYIIKPTICSGTNKSVALIKNSDDLNNYLETLNPEEEYIIQEFYKSKNEIGVLYEKIPHINDGEIISIVLKKNNTGSWKPLKCGNIKNDETTICDDLTKKLKKSNFVKIIKNISSKIPNFNAGRYDIGFETIDDLNKGKFKIFELNGVMGFDLRSNISDDETVLSLIQKNKYMVRWELMRYLMGFINICTFKTTPFYIMQKIPMALSNAYKCNDCEHIYQSSPA